MVPKSDKHKNVAKEKKRITRLNQQHKIVKVEKRTTRSDKQKQVEKAQKRTIPHINFYPMVCIHVTFFSLHFCVWKLIFCMLT